MPHTRGIQRALSRDCRRTAVLRGGHAARLSEAVRESRRQGDEMLRSIDTAVDGASTARRKPFHLVMIKPSHYDDEGYPIQWVRSAIPSNTLACLNGLAEDARARQVLGPDVEICLHTYDETNRRVRPDRIIKDIGKAKGKALIALVGVQSNQFP